MCIYVFIRHIVSQDELPWWLRWQRICLQCRRPGFDSWAGKIPWRKEWPPSPLFLGCFFTSSSGRCEEDSSEASLVVQLVKNLPPMQETWVRFLGQENLLEKEMAAHSSILAWRIPWTEESGRPQSMGLQESDMISN